MRKIYLVLLTLLLIIFFPLHKVYGGVCNGLSKDDCSKKIKELEDQISQLSDQARTLSSQIKYMDSQITLTVAKIQNTEESIKTTEAEIENLSGKIDKLNKSLDYLSKILLSKIAESYKSRSVSVFDIFLSSNNASSLFKNIRYVQAAQNNDHFVAVKVERSKLSYEEKKLLREEKKKELEQLKISLNNQKIGLDLQKNQKQSLLTQTNNDEKKYKQLLQQAMSEYQALQNAIVSGLKVGPVKKGDPIALMGNTGYPSCSTGPHLHFEVRKDGSWTNPRDYLGGRFIWPMSDPIIITQEYGLTDFSWRYTYSGGIHTGIDMVSKSSDVIRAVDDGTLYSSTQMCGSSSMNVKYIEHSDGLVTFYLHVQ